jgi:CBS domain containing-hemolysin-like protein
VLEEQEEQMLHRVFGFADLTAGQVMVPRTELVAVRADTPMPDLLRTIGQGAPTRLPVYREDLDDVVGMLHVADLVKALSSGAGGSVNAGTLAREVLTVPVTLGADDLLAEMRRRKAREALVIDEHGGTAGLVTFESLMERIIGEIPGEMGAQTRTVVRTDGSADIDGLTLVSDANAQFGLSIDEDTYTTIGGYMLGWLGRRARVGDTIDVEGRRMTVEAVDGLRVAKVWLSNPADAKRS